VILKNVISFLHGINRFVFAMDLIVSPPLSIIPPIHHNLLQLHNTVTGLQRGEAWGISSINSVPRMGT
jgi:hypothetical protein